MSNKRKDLKSDRSQWHALASVECGDPFLGRDIAKNAKGKTRVLLTDTKSIEQIIEDYSGNASKASNHKFSTQIACKKLIWCEIHYD